MKSNIHIESFLNQYLNGASNPNYAVLIKGDWGAGKTYFIRKYFLNENIHEIYNYITNCKEYCVVYTSLFGAKNREEMDQRVVDTLHPFLKDDNLNLVKKAVPLVGALISIIAASHGVPFIGTIAPTIYEKVKNFFSKDGSVDSIKEIGLGFSEIFIEEIKKKSSQIKKVVVVFDDVERADMPIPELLGYINEYVEYLHVPCILLAEKKQWEEAQKCQKNNSTLHKLSSTQEKVIGKTFQLQTTLDDVWNSWEQKHPVGFRAWPIISKNKEVISKIFYASGMRNYRSLLHTFLDFERFIGVTDNKLDQMFIDDVYLSVPDFTKLLVADFFCFQYAYHIGILNPDDIIVDDPSLKGKNGDEKNTFYIFNEKFNRIDRLSNLPDNNNVSLSEMYSNDWLAIWKEWLQSSFISSEKIEKSIRNSIWFNQKEEFNLIQLKNYAQLSDEAASHCLAELDKVLYKEKNVTPSELYTIYYYITTYAYKDYWNYDVLTLDTKMREWLKDIEFEDTTLVPLKIFRTDERELYDIQKKFYAEIAKKINYKSISKDEKTISRFYQLFDDINDFEVQCKQIVSSKSFPFWKLDVKKLLNKYMELPAGNRAVLCEAFQNHFNKLSNKSGLQSNLENDKKFIIDLSKEINCIVKKSSKPYQPSLIALIELGSFLEKQNLNYKKDTVKKKVKSNFVESQNLHNGEMHKKKTRQSVKKGMKKVKKDVV